MQFLNYSKLFNSKFKKCIYLLFFFFFIILERKINYMCTRQNKYINLYIQRYINKELLEGAVVQNLART